MTSISSRFLFLALVIFGFSACRSNQNERQEALDSIKESVAGDTLFQKDLNRPSISAEDSLVHARIESYNDDQLMSFFDSISRLDLDSLGANVTLHIDSTFRSRPKSNRELSKLEFQMLRAAASTGKVSLSLATSLFTHGIDSMSLEGDSVSVQFYQFRKKDFEEFAVLLGHPSAGWSNDVYFFKGSRMISFHHNFHRSSFNPHHFQDTDGRTVFYYIENFGSGSGMWEHQYFFYKYYGDEIAPVLNLIENSNFSWATGYRDLWFESKILREQPLEVKFVYHVSLPDSAYSEFVRIVDDSVVVRFDFNQSTRRYDGKFSSKLTEAQMKSYYLDTEQPFFIRAHRDLLRRLMATTDRRRRAVLFYLALLYDDQLHPVK